MSRYTKLFERAGTRYEVPTLSAEGILRRRDRKRRRQRVTAGVVGLVVFMAAIWITTGGPFDRAHTPIVPGGASTGTMTGPSETGSGSPDVSERVGFIGLPPEGVTPSLPEHGKQVLALGSTIAFRAFAAWIYDDGRVIWVRNNPLSTGGLLEQRLTPDGVELLLAEIASSSAVSLQDLLTGRSSWLPASAWADRTIRAYVPSRFAVCPAWRSGGKKEFEASGVLTLLPAAVADTLRASDEMPQIDCYGMATEDARTLVETLKQAGFERFAEGSAANVLSYHATAGGKEIDFDFNPILPNGEAVFLQFG